MEKRHKSYISARKEVGAKENGGEKQESSVSVRKEVRLKEDGEEIQESYTSARKENGSVRKRRKILQFN